MLDYYFQEHNYSIAYAHMVSTTPPLSDFHFHERYEIHCIVSGDVQFFIEKNIYSMKPGDIILINSNEIHKPNLLSDKPFERIVVQFLPQVVRVFNSPNFNLLHCFESRPKGEQNKLSLSEKQLSIIKKLFSKLEILEKNLTESSVIMKLNVFIELLIIMNEFFMNTYIPKHENNVPDKLVPILDYIELNLNKGVTVESLANTFFINRFYLSRLFKNATGMNLNEYLLAKKVGLAKDFLLKGYSVTDACQMSGFNDYSNFIRTFKNSLGITPGQYKKNRLGIT